MVEKFIEYFKGTRGLGKAYDKSATAATKAQGTVLRGAGSLIGDFSPTVGSTREGIAEGIKRGSSKIIGKKPTMKIGAASRGIGRTTKGAGKFLRGLTNTRIGGTVGKAVKFGILGVGAVSMLSTSILKGAMDTAKEQKYERYMESQARVKGVLNKSRTPKGMSNNSISRQSTIGLSNALSKTRHGY